MSEYLVLALLALGVAALGYFVWRSGKVGLDKRLDEARAPHVDGPHERAHEAQRAGMVAGVEPPSTSGHSDGS